MAFFVSYKLENVRFFSSLDTSLTQRSHLSINLNKLSTGMEALKYSTPTKEGAQFNRKASTDHL